MDSRARIITATLDCLSRMGIEHTSISAVAERARVSRPTIYAHFGTREVLISAALEEAGLAMVRDLLDDLKMVDSAADFAVNSCLGVLAGLRASPMRAVFEDRSVTGPTYLQEALTPRVLTMAVEFVRPLSAYQPSLEAELPEIAETMIRWVLSLLMFDSEVSLSDELLRAYLYRRLIPALGIDQPS
jgi:AcrR family transcriptional regulator